MIARVAMLIVLVAGCGRPGEFCQVCQREECTGLAFRVTLEDGRRVQTCCPRCGLHYLKTANAPARQIQASDFGSGKWIDAKTALYVEDSDVSHCAGKEVRRDQFGCCYYKGFDRCLPSLIAFADAEAAAKFQQRHGGKLVRFEKLITN